MARNYWKPLEFLKMNGNGCILLELLDIAGNGFKCLETSLLHRLQAQTLPNEAPPMGKIHPFSKIAVTFEPVMQFGRPSGFRVS